MGCIDDYAITRLYRFDGHPDVITIPEHEDLRCLPDNLFEPDHGTHPQPKLPQEEVLDEVPG